MDKLLKIKLRGILFRHLDGIAIAPTVSALYNQDICSYILKHPQFTLQDILANFHANSGYMNIALRLLSSQGWLHRKIILDGKEINYNLTEKGNILFPLSHKYSSYIQSIPALIDFEKALFNQIPNQYNYKQLFDNLIQLRSTNRNKNSPASEIITHIEGLILGPIIVTLGMSQLLNQYLDDNKKIDKNVTNNFPHLQSVLYLFTNLDWIKNDKFTSVGNFFLKRASAYGVTVSYLSTFLHTYNLLFDDPTIIWKKTENGSETHVNRRMNVWGSGGAHKLYFKKIDDIIINLFNKPLDDQPIGIADMGCGDGTLLKHY